MKIIFVILAICLVVYFIIFYYNYRSNPKLIAIAGQGKEIVFLAELTTKEKNEVYEAFELAKVDLGKTLELRIKFRGNEFSNQFPSTIYIVAFKDSLYLFEDNYPYKAPGLEVPGKSLVNSIEFNRTTKKTKINK